ncbi:UNVERIFIED_ORG: adenosylcobinamide-phosphate synthase CbiB [Shinella sp. XGS7]|nr:adenosylcobinamide-phosphate synthase CbiB [Shinella sp. XGS7]
MSLMPLLLPLAMLLALLVDRLFGEPPARLHPVVGMGQYLGFFGPRLTALPPGPAFIGGALAWLLGALLSAALALSLEMALMQALRPWAGLPGLLLCALALGLLLKPLLAWRMLAEEVQAVEAALQESLEAGRARLARLVSRDTRALSAAEVREAAIETLAENLNDSVVAPLFWFALAGLPGAALYRFANTADAMWGYRDQREWSGKFAARADDVLSWLPARLTGLLMIPLWQLPRLLREAGRTPSPNSGWPMAAMALTLGLSLGKPGVYRLNEAGSPPEPAHMAQALRRARLTLWRCSGLLVLLALGWRLV